MPLLLRLACMVFLAAASEAYKGNPFVFPIQRIRENYRVPPACYEPSNRRCYGNSIEHNPVVRSIKVANGFPFPEELMV